MENYYQQPQQFYGGYQRPQPVQQMKSVYKVYLVQPRQRLPPMPGHFSLYDVSGRLIRRYIIEIDKALHFAPVHCLKFRLAVLMYRIGDIRRYDADRIIAGEQNNINVTLG